MPKNLGNPYFDAANTGAQLAGAELGVKVLYQGPTTADATAQITMLDSLIAQKVNGMAISADDADALVPTGKQAIAAGIPVVSWDSPISAGGRLTFVNQASTQGIGDVEVKMALDLTGPSGRRDRHPQRHCPSPEPEYLDWDHEGRPGNACIFHAQTRHRSLWQ